MPRSISFSFLITLIGFLVFLYLNRERAPPATRDEYVSFTVDLFNLCTLIALAIILHRNEKTGPEEFGRVMRENMSTITVALLINIVYAFLSVWSSVFTPIRW